MSCRMCITKTLTLNQRLLVSANTCLHVCDITMPYLEDTIIAIHCDSVCANFRFLKYRPVDHTGVLQTPINVLTFCYLSIFPCTVCNIPSNFIITDIFVSDFSFCHGSTSWSSRSSPACSSLSSTYCSSASSANQPQESAT